MFDQAVGCAFLVEDSDQDIAIFEYAARKMKFPITLQTHRSGSSALEAINHFSGLNSTQLPNLFVLDISIPDVNGVDICKQIVKSYSVQRKAEPYIVFLTSLPTKEAIQLASESAHIRVISKPKCLAEYQGVFSDMFTLVKGDHAHQGTPTLN